jgi:hypothetical protein
MSKEVSNKVTRCSYEGYKRSIKSSFEGLIIGHKMILRRSQKVHWKVIGSP